MMAPARSILARRSMRSAPRVARPGFGAGHVARLAAPHAANARSRKEGAAMA